MMRDFDYRLRYQGLSLEDYLSFSAMTKEALQEQMRPEAQERVKQSLVIEAIGKAESVEVTEEDMEKEFEEMAKLYKMPADKLKETMRGQDIDYMRETVQSKKIVGLIKENAKLK